MHSLIHLSRDQGCTSDCGVRRILGSGGVQWQGGAKRVDGSRCMYQRRIPHSGTAGLSSNKK
jgi:hypothetical protein